MNDVGACEAPYMGDWPTSNLLQTVGTTPRGNTNDDLVGVYPFYLDIYWRAKVVNLGRT